MFIFLIVMLILGVAALWISIWKPVFYKKLANYLLIGGFISLVFSLISGLSGVDYAIQHLNASREIINIHQRFAFFSILSFALVLVLLFFQRRKTTVFLTGIVLFLSVISVVLLTITGHYGGQLVYQ
ncbi:DUF2231 domain-containing protein [Paenibacillus sp. 8b26]|uniref:DUF2231 domain-containing protein n=1 Tax=Paenibacillus sp. 8b26 TaxID=3424133 RepID=UPI003D6467BB